MADEQVFLSRDEVSHLLVTFDGICWWCRERPANTGEHKYKASDLVRLMGDGHLVWGDSTGRTHEIRGRSGVQRDRNKVVKFPKSLCDRCNNARSQPFDRSYDVFSEYASKHPLTRHLPGVGFREIYGSDWSQDVLNLARYYGKHFGCQMVQTGLPVPESLRIFLDGGVDMTDAHMALITTDSIHKSARSSGFTISAACAFTDPARARVESCVLACYIGSIGVRYAWYQAGLADAERSQFFHFPNPLINRFCDEAAVVNGQPRRQGMAARFLQWINAPAAQG